MWVVARLGGATSKTETCHFLNVSIHTYIQATKRKGGGGHVKFYTNGKGGGG